MSGNTLQAIRPKCRGGWLIVLAAVVLSVDAANASDERFPLEPPDRSGPRETLLSFMNASAAGNRAYERNAQAEEILQHFRRSDATLDLSEISPEVVSRIGTEVGLLLYEVLIRSSIPRL